MDPERDPDRDPEAVPERFEEMVELSLLDFLFDKFCTVFLLPAF